MIDTRKLQYRGRYGIATGGAISDPVLLGVAAEFDNQVMRRIDALAPADLATRYAGSDQVLVSTKYDGESTFIYFEQGRDAFCFSAHSGRARLGFRALDELSAKLVAQGVNKCLIRAELILPQAGEGRRPAVSDVIRVSFSGSDAEIDSLQIVLLDVAMHDGRNLIAQQSEFASILALMQSWAGTDPAAPCFAMQASVIAENEIPAAFQRVIEGGGEGIVVRRLNRAEARKVKPHRTIDGVILGFVEDEFEGQFGVASLLTGLVYPSESGGNAFLQTFVRVGSGLSDADRTQLLDQLRPLVVDAPLPMTDSSGRGVRFVRPLLTAEIHGEDLVSSDGGREQRTQLLAWNAEAQRYEFLGLAPGARLSFARFACLRGDKIWNAGGARIEQIGLSNRPTPIAGDASAQVIRREVYLKGEMLRKLTVVQKADPDLPFPFLIYWTDYSGKRAEALKVSLEVAATRERADAIAERLLREEITKGFARHG